MQTELERIARVTALGELAASIAHEINQPLAAIVAVANACLNWLATDRPDLENVREALAGIVSDGDRAAQVVTRIAALLARSSVERQPCDPARVIGDVALLVRPELRRHGIVLETIVEAKLPQDQPLDHRAARGGCGRPRTGSTAPPSTSRCRRLDEADGFMRDLDAALGHHLLHVANAQDTKHSPRNGG